MPAVGTTSRTCWNDQRLKGGFSQLARLTCPSGSGGNPCINLPSLMRQAFLCSGLCRGQIALLRARSVEKIVLPAIDAVDRAIGGIADLNGVAGVFCTKTR